MNNNKNQIIYHILKANLLIDNFNQIKINKKQIDYHNLRVNLSIVKINQMKINNEIKFLKVMEIRINKN